MPVFNISDGWSFTWRWERLASNSCQVADSVDMVLDITVETIGNGIVLYELICLWGTNKRVARLMAAGFIILHSVTIIPLGTAVIQLRKNLHFFRLNDVFRACYATGNPPAFKSIYIPVIALDIYAFILLLLNALSRPRSSSQKLLDLLRSGPITFFSFQLVLSSLTDGITAMRAMCLIINVVPPSSLSAQGFSSASVIVATAVSRLYLRLDVSSMHKDLELSIYGSIYVIEMLLEECELQKRRAKLHDSRLDKIQFSHDVFRVVHILRLSCNHCFFPPNGLGLVWTTVFLPINGGLAQMFGRRIIILTMVFLFAVGTVMCDAAPSLNFLIVSRTLLGIGAGGEAS
ncbi:hypothetical protein ACEPAI_1401 [Sanghuangporus weigelae]